MTFHVDPTLRDWLIGAYDDFEPDQVEDDDEDDDRGVLVETSREGVAKAYAAAVEAGKVTALTLDRVAEGRVLFDAVILPLRTQRRDLMRNSVQYLLDALNGGTILGRRDPVFVVKFPLGTGYDKALGQWTAADWREAIIGRYANAAKATKAADAFRELVEDLIDRLNRLGTEAETVDLFGDDDAD